MLRVQDCWSAGGGRSKAPIRHMLLRRAALRYVEHAWPVLPGAYLTGGRFSCGAGCPTFGCHPAYQPWESTVTWERRMARRLWTLRPFAVLLATGISFDVLEVPAHIGMATTRFAGPVALTPPGRWMFLVRAGAELHPELAAHHDVVLHGRGSWIPAPPTRTPDGRVRWLVSPHECGWRLPDSRQVQWAMAVAAPRLALPVAVSRAA